MAPGDRMVLDIGLDPVDDRIDVVTIIEVHRHARKAVVQFDSGARLTVDTDLLALGTQ